MKILVTSAAGKTGLAAAKALLELGCSVRAFIHRKTDKALALEKLGAELFVGDMNDIRDLRESMIGVDRAYFCVPFAQASLFKSITFAVAAEQMGLKHVVAMTQWLSCSSHHSLHTKEHWLADQIFKMSTKINYTIVNPGLFADVYFLMLEPMAQLGILPAPFGDGLNAPPSNEDIGRVVAHILKSPSIHTGKIYRPTGPELLSPQTIADIVGNELGRKVKYMNVSEKMFLKAIKSAGFPINEYSQLKYYNEDYRRNAFAVGAPTNVVEEITGSKAESFQVIARRYITERPEAQLNLSNKVQALWNFMKIPFTPTPDTKKYELEQGHPIFRNMQFAQDNAEWLQTHKIKHQSAPALDVNSAKFILSN